jgi:hypothetical protein
MTFGDVRQSLELYKEKGIPTGGFLRACLTNNFMEAMTRADESSKRILYEIALYIYNVLPAGCWGSEEKVNKWIAHQGEVGFTSPDPSLASSDSSDSE